MENDASLVTGALAVGDGHELYWEQRGNPNGKPVVVLHGGPGSGSSPAFAFMFDFERYRIVQFDQRNCGRSTPHASDPAVDLATNTTAHLIADIERLRVHLGIERWMVWGGSWGTVLALAYAEAYPGRVTELVLVSVADPSPAQVGWMTHDMGRVFPEAFERFVEIVPAAERDGDLSAAYRRLLASSEAAVRERAAFEWCRWEDTHVSTAPGYEHDPRYDDARFRMCFARIVTHYWSNACFLEEGQLLRDAERLAGIPGVMINGRLDISGPPDTAWQLAKRWRDAELVVVGDAGHGVRYGSTLEAVLAATNRFAS